MKLKIQQKKTVLDKRVNMGGSHDTQYCTTKQATVLEEDLTPTHLGSFPTNSQSITKTASLTVITIPLHKPATFIGRLLAFTSILRLNQTPLCNLVILQHKVKALDNLTTLRNG